MSTVQIWSGLETIGGNIAEIRTDEAHVITDFGYISNPELGNLPSLDFFEGETAVFITHLHLDHTGNLPQVPKDTLIYMSSKSYKLYEKLLDIGEEKPTVAKVSPVEFGKIIQVGDIKVHFEESDHDIQGVSAIFIETPDKKIINSGDLRLNGNHPERVNNWVTKAQKFSPDILLLEGTAFSFDDHEDETEGLTEDQLYDSYVNILHDSNEIIFINPYIRNTERLSRLIDLTVENSRKMVLESDFAHLMALEEQDNFEILGESITLEEIKNNPSDYVLQNRFNHIDTVKEFQQGIYLHSNGEPIGDYDPRFADMQAILAEAGIEYRSLAASGHGREGDIVSVAKAINAKVTIPWHTMHPGKMYQVLEENQVTSLIASYKQTY